MNNRTGRRLLSLDVLRGMTIVGMILVNSAAAMKYDAGATVFPLLLHAHWDGLTLADLVFPGFLMMVGVAIPFAMQAGGSDKKVADIIGRALRLFILGVILSNLHWFSTLEGDWRFFGVLQRIGLVYAACALLFMSVGPRARIALIAMLLIAYWPLALLPSPDGLGTDIMARGHNFVAWADRALLGAGNHLYVTGPEGYDPEGLLGTLPAIAHGLIGIAVGEWIRRDRPDMLAKLTLAGGAMLAAGIAWSFAFPVIKDIWSSSFVLVNAGITTLMLALLYRLLDARNGAASSDARAVAALPSWPVGAMLSFGINAIAAYVLHQITSAMPVWKAFLAPFETLRGAIGDPLASLVPILLYIAFIWLCVDYLRRRRWIVKI